MKNVESMHEHCPPYCIRNILQVAQYVYKVTEEGSSTDRGTP